LGQYEIQRSLQIMQQCHRGRPKSLSYIFIYTQRLSQASSYFGEIPP
jgi:hypothetical protein